MAFCGNSTLWNWNSSVNSSWPRLPQCFQATVLVYVPALYLMISSIAYVPYLLTHSRMIRPVDSPLSIAKTVLSIALTAVAIAAMIADAFSEPPSLSSAEEEFHPMTSSRYVAKVVEILSYMTTVPLVQIEKQRSVLTSGVLFIYWLLLFVCDIPSILTYLEIQMYAVSPSKFALFSISMFMIGTQLVFNCFADVRLTRKRYRSKENSPDLTASFLSCLVFFWMSRLLYTGYKRPLRPSDLWNLKPNDCCKKVLSRFERAQLVPKYRGDSRHISNPKMKNNLRPQCKHMDDLVNSSSLLTDSERVPLLNSTKRQEKDKDTGTIFSDGYRDSREAEGLFQILIRAFGKEVSISYLCKFVADSLQFAAPFLLKELIDYVSLETRTDGVKQETWYAYLVVVTMFIASWLQTVFYHQHFHLAMSSGMRMKTALMGAIYKKSLRLSNSGRQARSSGEVVNLMSVDAQRVQEMMSYTWMVWSIPYQIFLAVFLLWDTMGVPVLAGVGLLMLLIPFNALLAYRQQILQRVNLMWKDQRIKLLSEVLSGMKVLKLYAWEDVFCNKIKAIRREEVKVLTQLAWLSAGGTFMWTCAPYLVSLVSFGTFILISPTAVLTAQIAFITLSLFNILQFPVAFIPECVNFTSQAVVALRRIHEFLNEKELDKKKDKNDTEYVSKDDTSHSDEISLFIEKGIFAWDPSDFFRIHCARLAVSRGTLTAVVGAVGSGKTSFLSSLLGEMDKMQGEITMRGSVAYVPQTAWIQNATVQQNILFGQTFHPKRYSGVIRACVLQADLKTFPAGDMAEIGEKGANLSGGQRQRVGLARALYSDADVYVMDDPLSAVDSTVGKQIFKRALSERGFLKDKTRIMATHAIQWLPLVDQIIFMQGGRVTETGTYIELTMRDGQFTQFLRKEMTKESDDDLSSQDEEVRNMKKTMREHVEAITSCSESATSGDEIKRKQTLRNEDLTTSKLIQNDPRPTSLNNNNNNMCESAKRRHHSDENSNKMIMPSPIVDQEYLEDGNVKLSVYGKYCKNIGYFCTCVIIGLFMAYEVSGMLANLWLAEWTGDESFVANGTTVLQVERWNFHYLKGYGILGAFQVLFIFIYAFLVAIRMVQASSRLHTAALTRVLKAPMSFFDTTLTGRILNRFSRDVENIDNELPQVLLMFIMCVFSVFSTFVVISLQSALFISAIVPLFIMYWAVQRFFVRGSRQVKRMEAVSRSPIFTQFSETLSGCQIIRAFDRSRWFELEFNKRLDENNVFYYAGISANRWLGVWIEFISSLVVLVTTVFLLITPGVDGATLGLAVTYALQITQALKWLVRSMSDIETNSVSLERIMEFAQVPQEQSHVMDEIIPRFWPDGGEIVFNHVTASYRPGLDPVLRDVSLRIAPGEKIGIVGRTGAGKSSLTLALFRIIEIDEGEITLDNVNIGHIGLHTLRSCIAILPQDPVLISGHLRANLDPKGEHPDEAIWKALTLVNLRNAVASLPGQLETEVGENGSKFSIGQKQLLCLARALLKPAKVLVMDEPTSSVDSDTDALVQHTINRAFQGCTTITIAHRITTILDCDRVMVMDAGRVIEFDSPMKLLKDHDSQFTALAKASGCKPQRPKGLIHKT